MSATDTTPLDVPARRRRRVIFAVVTVSLFIGAMLLFRGVLLPFVLGILLAYLLDPVVTAALKVRVRGRGVPRWAAVLVIYVVLVAGIVVAVLAVTPRVVRETRQFALQEVPSIRQRAERTWLPTTRRWIGRVQGALGQGRPPAERRDDDERPPDNSMRVEPLPGGGYRVVLPPDGIEVERIDENHYRAMPVRPGGGSTPNYLRQLRQLGEGHIADIVRVGRGIIGGVIGGIFAFFLTLMVSAYLLVTEAKIFGFLRGLVHPERREAFDELLQRLDRGLSGVVRGQLIICMVNGGLSAIGFALADLKYWPTLALVATVFSLIPIFGTILSSIPAVAMGLTQGFGTGLFVLLWILGIHQLEANLLNPKIMGDSAKIHPVLVVFSLLAGEHLFGILGALLAVPTMSIAQSLFLHWRKYALAYDGDAPEAREGP